MKLEKHVRNLLISIKHNLVVFKARFRKPTYDAKIICIGYNKTGTTSLGKSLRMLGYDHASFNRVIWRKYYKKGKIDKVLNFAAKFESLDDLPWLNKDMIPVLDETFPNSKFIYLTRDEESWKKSLNNWRLKKFNDVPVMEEKLKDFRSHKNFVLDYFKDSSKERFITLDIKDKKGFKKLAMFLEKEVQPESFPHFNKT